MRKNSIELILKSIDKFEFPFNWYSVATLILNFQSTNKESFRPDKISTSMYLNLIKIYTFFHLLMD